MNKPKIRKSIFETNSSSTHSIIFSKENGIDQTIKSENGIIKIEVGEYGWDVDSFYYPQEKASYLATAIKNYYSDEKRKILIENFVNAIKEISGATDVFIIPISGENKFNKMIEVAEKLRKQGLDIPLTKAVEITKEKEREEEEYWGYIDHQSGPGEQPENWDEVLRDKESIKKFIFSSANYFTTGNDNE
ncbi:MAG: hypothetical protein WC197_06780 [Candidatus Gastranaerophilaceae bacterium]|jgi:hypothetical protein